MEEGGHRQADLAEALGVSIDRVKSLTSGRVKKLSSQEMRDLVEKLHVRPVFLTTGELPIFQRPEDVALGERMQLLSDASQKATSLELPPRYQVLVRDVLVGAALGQSALLMATINGFVIDEIAERSKNEVAKEAPKPNRERKRTTKGATK